MSESDGTVVMLSALQHYLFCPRQCALIHVEDAWDENYLTVSGRQLHERSDSGVCETRSDVHRATSLRLFSRRLGLAGVADVVEFHAVGAVLDGNKTGAVLPGRRGLWHPFPVEYKRGKPKSHRADEVQLCAQALCLEEMLNVSIEKGALFYGETRRREDVVFDESLRALTEETATAVRKLLEEGVTPEPVFTPGCEACSLAGRCQPQICAKRDCVDKWVRDRVDSILMS